MTGASVHYDVRQDRAERHDWHMMSARGASDRQDHDAKPSLLTSIGSTGPHEGEEGPDDPEGFWLSLSLVLLFPLL